MTKQEEFLDLLQQMPTAERVAYIDHLRALVVEREAHA